ncbi:MAG: LURP-one-related family protein [Lachnospiraceae bacterium]|nr:LURP-one-related family protein [Lachnospiraceae bacterium]MDD3796394.1 LURP-one-related family protein [Lachnospiraceae bacterium]
MKIFLKSKIVSLKHEIDIMDENMEKIYEVTSRFISIHDKTVLINAKTEEKVADIHRKPLSFHEVYYVDMVDGTKFEFNTEIFKIVHEEINIKGLDWKITGNFLQHDFDVVNEQGSIVASSHKKWVSLHDSYEVDVVDEAHLETIVAIYAVLDHIIASRETNTTVSTNEN